MQEQRKLRSLLLKYYPKMIIECLNNQIFYKNAKFSGTLSECFHIMQNRFKSVRHKNMRNQNIAISSR